MILHNSIVFVWEKQIYNRETLEKKKSHKIIPTTAIIPISNKVWGMDGKKN